MSEQHPHRGSDWTPSLCVAASILYERWLVSPFSHPVELPQQKARSFARGRGAIGPSPLNWNRMNETHIDHIEQIAIEQTETGVRLTIAQQVYIMSPNIARAIAYGFISTGLHEILKAQILNDFRNGQ